MTVQFAKGVVLAILHMQPGTKKRYPATIAFFVDRD